MHIKKLEISGFKSFVDRTVIPFDHDLIGIVGPNGCGKSNVVDAIRWTMGEQSAKALRGRAMADVIFNGSESRSPHGFAEVTLTFDNSDPETAQTLPLEYRDYAEIAVTRRLYRDGTSEYLINKVPVRLRDVTEVFLGTGVGRKAYSIVEQGKIGLIVSARPEDRRILIEEAAGITKYKARRRQAEQKMQQTRQNLLRIGDIVAELERQIASLKRQAAKARRYLRYRAEIDDLVLWEASQRLLEYIVTTEVAEKARAEASEAVQVQRATVDARDAEVEVLRMAAHEAERNAERTQNEAFSSDNLVREHETQIERSQDRLEHLDERLHTARQEQRELERKAEQLGAERAELERLATDTEAEQAEEERRVQSAAEELVEAETASDQAGRQLIDLRQRQSDVAAKVAAAEATIAGVGQRQEELGQRRIRLSGQLDELRGEDGKLDQQLEELAERVRDMQSRNHAMCDARDALESELPGYRQALVEHDRVVEQRRAELSDDRSRLQALSEMAERLEGVDAGVRHLLATEDTSIEGLLASRIGVPEKLTAAFASAAGMRLQCVLVSDARRGLELLEQLAATGHGRASVIPRHPRRVAGAQRELPVRDGVLGLLIDHLEVAAEDEAAVRALVGDTVLVETAAAAHRLFEGGIHSEVVALDGTVFHADGRISGGTADGVATALVENQRELERLRHALSGRRQALDEALAHHEALRKRIRDLRTALDHAAGQAHEAEIELLTGEQELERVRARRQDVTERQASLGAELEELTRSLDATGGEQARAEEGLATGRGELESIEQELAVAEGNARARREQLTERQRIFTERKVVFAQVRERAAGSRAAVERVSRSLDELEERIAALEAERTSAAEEAGRVAASILQRRQELLDAKRSARDARSAFEGAKDELDDARHTLGLQEAELRQLRAALEQATEQMQHHEMECQRLSLERSHLEQNIRERFRGLELATVVGDYHARPPMDEQQRLRIRELEELIDRMGSVNLDAAKEFEEADERYRHYTEQHADLTQALEDLERAIAQMNRESRRLFKRAFEGINAEFQQVFPRLFHGGKAELRLTQPDDLLETGIDILAQPPGKKLGNIELMSGGEKAFTAVALLFAIFHFKPSPFCILDEVDAPLDDANVERYVENIRAMTDRSQFIVITHSKRTMQAVDVLYGVTMQEPGVSKLVGVRVSEAARTHGLRSERMSHPPPAAATEAAMAS
jgi:chromosome segregation protein